MADDFFTVFTFVAFFVNFLFMEYWIWYPVVDSGCFFQATWNPFALAATFVILVGLGTIWNVLVTVPS